MHSLILRSFFSNGIWGCDWSWFLIISHALSIVLTVQNWRGLPTLRWSVSLGMADLVAKVDWWRGCCLSLFRMCPNSLSFFLEELQSVAWFFSSSLLPALLRFHSLFGKHIHWNFFVVQKWCSVSRFSWVPWAEKCLIAVQPSPLVLTFPNRKVVYCKWLRWRLIVSTFAAVRFQPKNI